MIKVVTLVGARPQFIKAAALSRVIRDSYANTIKEVLVHSGQHYDENMSDVFFTEMDIPKPNYHLEVGSGSHAKQTAQISLKFEEVLNTEKPDIVVVYGDTNTTIAGALTAAKLHIPIAHVEAGLRSYNKNMPEELNRVLTDHVSDFLFCPTQTAINNLQKENFSNSIIHHSGDIMYDASLYYGQKADESVLAKNGLEKNNYWLATIHRQSNTDDVKQLNHLFISLLELVKEQNAKLVLPLHPRTKKAIETHLDKAVLEEIYSTDNFLLMPPASYLEMVALEKNCSLVFTDSGGVQKEAYFYQKPCVVLRKETEWVELIESGRAVLAPKDIKAGVEKVLNNNSKDFPHFFGDGNTADFICKIIAKNIR